MRARISRIRTSVMGLLRESGDSAPDETLLEHIRDEMRDCASFFRPGQAGQSEFWTRLRNAPDIQALWYLRSDLMNLLSEGCGETQARALLDNITALFRGHLPAAQFASARRRQARATQAA